MKFKATLALASVLLLPLVAPLQANDETLIVSEFTFSYGEPWVRQQPASSMRAGQLLYDHQDENLKDVEMAIFYFGQGGGGGIQANVDRWLGQFEGTPESQVEEKKFEDRVITFVTATGTFLESMGGGPFAPGVSTPQAGYTMLAAILHSDHGPVFLKLTGPKDSVAALKADFDKFAVSPFAK